MKPKKRRAAETRGRPETRTIKLDATPEQAARAIFSAVKPPDPTLHRKSTRNGLARKSSHK